MLPGAKQAESASFRDNRVVTLPIITDFEKSMQGALTLPELLIGILEHASNGTLANAAQVCTTWSEHALNILWGRDPRSLYFEVLEIIPAVRRARLLTQRESSFLSKTPEGLERINRELEELGNAALEEVPTDQLFIAIVSLKPSFNFFILFNYMLLPASTLGRQVKTNTIRLAYGDETFLPLF
jgi:hypothetical protein